MIMDCYSSKRSQPFQPTYCFQTHNKKKRGNAVSLVMSPSRLRVKLNGSAFFPGDELHGLVSFYGGSSPLLWASAQVHGYAVLNSSWRFPNTGENLPAPSLRRGSSVAISGPGVHRDSQHRNLFVTQAVILGCNILPSPASSCRFLRCLCSSRPYHGS